MAHYKLPNPLFSWAWTPQYLAKAENSHSSLILPQSTPDPAFCHFSQMRIGNQFSWLWFFQSEAEAVALRLLQDLSITDSLAELVALTIPKSLPDCVPTYLVLVDQRWLASMPLRELGIDEVWVGFDYRRYVRDRNPRAATTTVLSAEEFCLVGTR
ncbi:MAG: hypothetical protein ACO3TI_05260 [Aquiluna sp.]|jgi:hypothetical protein